MPLEHPKAVDAEDAQHPTADENTSQVQFLKELLLQQTRRSEHLGQQAAARDWERWELLQLLRQKDEQLEFEEAAAAKQRVVLSSARAGARHYRAVCCLRAWRNHVQQLCAERALLRAKNKQAVARLRHAGSLLHLVLKHVLDRQLKSGMHRLWLHASTSMFAPEDLVETRQRERRKEDVSFFTPPKSGHGLRFSPVPSPRVPIPNSEAPTELPSCDMLQSTSGLRSSTSSGWHSAGIQETATRLFKPDMAAARLAIDLQTMLFQRLHWSLGQWRCKEASAACQLEERQCFESRFATLEQQAADQASWRSAAEECIREMTARSEKLERDRSLIRHELSAAQRQQQACSDQSQALRESLEQEEQLGELLRARLWALEQDGEQMFQEVETHKLISMEGEEHFEQQLAALDAERCELRASLQVVKSSQEAAVQQAANKVRKSLLEAWGRDRGKWAQEREKLTSTADRAAEEAKLALMAARSAEADASAKARYAAEADKVARAKLFGEENVCHRLAAELRERINQAESIEADLDRRLKHAKESELEDRGIGVPSSIQLQELDSYAELVDRLRSEVAHERSEREVSAKSLSELRKSYRMLLQRNADCDLRGLRESRGQCRMPASPVH